MLSGRPPSAAARRSATWQGPVQLPVPVGPVVGAGAVVVEPDGDAELVQPLHIGGVLGIQSLLDLLCLPTGGRLVERAGLPVANNANRPMWRSLGARS
jgi:hypothetical protein